MKYIDNPKECDRQDTKFVHLFNVFNIFFWQSIPPVIITSKIILDHKNGLLGLTWLFT